jgi:hypothetical protein
MVVLEDRRAARAREADGWLQVLERDRQAVERSDWLAASETPIGGVSECEACLVRQQRDDRCEARIETMNLIEMRLHHLARRDLSVVNEARELASAEKAKIARSHRNRRS